MEPGQPKKKIRRLGEGVEEELEVPKDEKDLTTSPKKRNVGVIILKKTAIKNSKGCSLIPSAPSLTLLHQAKQANLELSRQIFNLSLENDNLKWEKKSCC